MSQAYTSSCSIVPHITITQNNHFNHHTIFKHVNLMQNLVSKNWFASDTIQARSNSDFKVKCATIQFYTKSHNSQSYHWIGLKVYVEFPDMFSYLGSKYHVNRSSERHPNTGQQRLYGFCYLLPLDLWTSYLAMILFLKGCGSLFWESPNSTMIFNGLQHSFQVWQRLINVSKSFSYKDSLFILATKRKEDFRTNSTFRFDSPILYVTSKG